MSNAGLAKKNQGNVYHVLMKTEKQTERNVFAKRGILKTHKMYLNV